MERDCVYDFCSGGAVLVGDVISVFVVECKVSRTGWENGSFIFTNCLTRSLARGSLSLEDDDFL